MTDTNNTAATTAAATPDGATALILFMTEDADVLAAIVPVASQLAKHAKAWHTRKARSVFSDEAMDSLEFVEDWFFDPLTKAEVCPSGELSGSDYATIVAIYRVGC